MTTSVKILYFSWLREKMGRSEETLALPSGVHTPEALMALLAERDERGAVAFADISFVHIAVDQNYAELDTLIEHAEEIAFFPPVTGG
ncbi:MAG: molybdopterin converting factor subunit 1 [Parvularculales bacterium]